MKRIGMLGLVLVLITLVSLGSMTIAQGPVRQPGGPARRSGGHKLPVAPETPATEEPAEAVAASAVLAAAWEPDLCYVEGPGLRAGVYSFVGGGLGNKANGAYSFVGGGRKNKADGDYSSVVGGYNNTAKSKYATVGGGQHNWCKGWRSTIAGGRDNETQSEYATVGGGRENKATQGYTTVGGGYSNQATDDYATVGGGYYNTASGPRATVGGGYDNEASGWYATVPGGRLNTASGKCSFAAGYRAKANHEGSLVLADYTVAQDFSSQREDQFRVRANGGARFDVNNSEWVDIRSSGGKVIDTSTGAYLSSGGTWTNSSDRQAKENIEVVDAQDVLDRLVVVPISTWNYIAQDATVQHMGPMAQDFHAAFGLGEDDRHIAALDLGGANTAAIQALYELVQEQAARIAELEARLAAIETRG